MFAKILRLGPCVVLEFIMMIGGIVLYTVLHWQAPGLTLIQSSLELFMIEFIISMRLIKKQRKYQKKYIKALAASTDFQLYGTLVWNEAQFISILMLFLYSLVHDAITIVGQFDGSDASYVSYPLIFQKELQIDLLLKTIIMWVAFAFVILFNGTLLYMAQKEHIQYCVHLIKNRSRILEELSEELVKGNTLTHLLYKNTNINKELEKSDSTCCEVCPVCLAEMENKQDLIKLYCGHSLHRICGQSWLCEKQICPFRCVR